MEGPQVPLEPSTLKEMQVLANVDLLQPNTYVVDSIQHVRESLIYEEKFQQENHKIEGVPVKIEFDH